MYTDRKIHMCSVWSESTKVFRQISSRARKTRMGEKQTELFILGQNGAMHEI